MKIIIKRVELKYFFGLRLHYYGGLSVLLTGEGEGIFIARISF